MDSKLRHRAGVSTTLLPASLAALALLLATTAARATASAGPMIELTLHGQRIEGSPLLWNKDQVVLLGRDGHLWEFPQDAGGWHNSSDRFRSMPVSELRSVLLREFGPGFEASGTRHFLILHPEGQRDHWAPALEYYRSLVHYFLVRGFHLSEPPSR